MEGRAIEADLLREPLFDPDRGKVIAEPHGRGPGHWAGAPGAACSDGLVHLAYRVRAPAPDRGHRLVITRSRDGLRFGSPMVITKEQLGALSIERCAIVPIDGTLRLFVSVVGTEDRKWRVDAIALDRIDDPAARRPVLHPDDIGVAGVKDPWIRSSADRWLMFVSFGSLPEDDFGDLHAGGDALSTGRTRSLTGLATSRDGLSWSWNGPVLEPSAGRWDSYTTRLTTAMRAGDGWVGFYDGSTVDGNYEERCGAAFSDDLMRWRKAEVDRPAIGTASGAGGVRYVEVCAMSDGSTLAYYEYTRRDGSHDLRVARVRGLRVG